MTYDWCCYVSTNSFSEMEEMTRAPDPRHVEVPDQAIVEILREKSPQERLRIGLNMWLSAHSMLMSHIRHSHPEWDQRAVEKEVARRMSHGAV